MRMSGISSISNTSPSKTAEMGLVTNTENFPLEMIGESIQDQHAGPHQLDSRDFLPDRREYDRMRDHDRSLGGEWR